MSLIKVGQKCEMFYDNLMVVVTVVAVKFPIVWLHRDDEVKTSCGTFAFK